MKMSETIGELAKALSKFQGEVRNVVPSATNPFFKSKYAPLEEVLKEVRPKLAKEGLSIIQYPLAQDNKVGVVTVLMHESGEYIQTEELLLVTDKNTAQGAGSAITYARRYALSAILGVAADEDDDGNVAEVKKNNKTNNNNYNKNTKSNKSDATETETEEMEVNCTQCGAETMPAERTKSNQFHGKTLCTKCMPKD